MGYRWNRPNLEVRVQGAQRKNVRLRCRFRHFLLSHRFSFLSFSNDLSWDGESKRIIAVGDGRDKYDFFFRQLVQSIIYLRPKVWPCVPIRYRLLRR